MSFSHPQYADRMYRAVRDEKFNLEQHIASERRLREAFATGLVLGKNQRVVKTEPKLLEPKLNLADYIEQEVALPPAVCRNTAASAGPLQDILGNDQWGDCGDAMALHGIEAFHLDAGTPVPPFVTGDALTLYSEVSGWDPNQGPSGQNPTDVGTDNARLVAYWQDPGISCAADSSTHQIAGSLGVELGNDYVSRLAIWEFVVLFRSVGLPVSAQGETTWRHPFGTPLEGDDAVGSWGYHDIPYLSFDPHYFHADSWGQDILVGYGWDHAYAVGGFVVLTPEQTNLQGVSPSGINWTKLNEDFRSLTSEPIS